jgi:hypothetical protein
MIGILPSCIVHKKDPNIQVYFYQQKNEWDSQPFITMEVTALDIANNSMIKCSK